MTYRPPRQGQFNPNTSTSAKDCVPATAAYLVEGGTVGLRKSDHAVIRKASGAPATRGLYLAEAAAAVRKLYGVELDVSLHCSRNTVRDTVAGGERAGVTIDTSVTRSTTRRTGLYIGPHEIFLVSYHWWPKGETCACEKQSQAAHGEYLVEDPGTSAGYLYWSADLVYRAGEKLTGGYDKINLLVAPDTEGVTRTAVVAAYVRTHPNRTAKQVGRLVTGRPYYVSETSNTEGTPGDGEGWCHVPTGWVRGGAFA